MLVFNNDLCSAIGISSAIFQDVNFETGFPVFSLSVNVKSIFTLTFIYNHLVFQILPNLD